MSGFTKAFGSVHDLPEPFASVCERGGPGISPYARLAKRWHEHAASSSPAYGQYIEVLAGKSRSPGSAAADIACGTGLSIGPPSARYAQVFGLDFSDDMLQVARARLGDHSRVSQSAGPRQFWVLVRRE
jgi:SAM-dependent methyltransferase